MNPWRSDWTEKGSRKPGELNVERGQQLEMISVLKRRVVRKAGYREQGKEGIWKGEVPLRSGRGPRATRKRFRGKFIFSGEGAGWQVTEECPG